MKRSSWFIALAIICVAALLIPVSRSTAPPEDEPELSLESEVSSFSQYDDIIKVKAAEYSFDWRFIAAVIYNESRFHNSAHSQKGAVGLMQIKSERYSIEELLDPSTNIEIGCRYLSRLRNDFSSSAVNSRECLKFALAAYNYGENKVRRLIEEANGYGLESGRWDQVATLLPKGHHTVFYVNKVLDTYSRYCTIAAE